MPAAIGILKNFLPLDHRIVIDKGDRLETEFWRAKQRRQDTSSAGACTVDQHLLRIHAPCSQRSYCDEDRVLLNGLQHRQA